MTLRGQKKKRNKLYCVFFFFKYRHKLNDIILTGDKMDSLNDVHHNDQTVQILILKKIYL